MIDAPLKLLRCGWSYELEYKIYPVQTQYGSGALLGYSNWDLSANAYSANVWLDVRVGCWLHLILVNNAGIQSRSRVKSIGWQSASDKTPSRV